MAYSSSDQVISDLVHLLINSLLILKDSERNWTMKFNKRETKIKCLSFNKWETKAENFFPNENHFRLLIISSTTYFPFGMSMSTRVKNKQEVLKTCISTSNLWVTRSFLPIDLIDTYSELNELVTRMISGEYINSDGGPEYTNSKKRMFMGL